MAVTCGKAAGQPSGLLRLAWAQLRRLRPLLALKARAPLGGATAFGGDEPHKRPPRAKTARSKPTEGATDRTRRRAAGGEPKQSSCSMPGQPRGTTRVKPPQTSETIGPTQVVAGPQPTNGLRKGGPSLTDPTAHTSGTRPTAACHQLRPGLEAA